MNCIQLFESQAPGSGFISHGQTLIYCIRNFVRTKQQQEQLDWMNLRRHWYCLKTVVQVGTACSRPRPV